MERCLTVAFIEHIDHVPEWALTDQSQLITAEL